MGEVSKATGDFGEDVVNSLLALIGWSSPLKNRDIKCFAPDDHRIGINPRQTHGIDRLYSYVTPLFDSIEDIIVISSKYEKYPDNPSSRFKSHIRDITDALFCLKKGKQFPGESNYRKNYIGIIFWLHHESSYADLVSKLSQYKYQNDARSDFDFVYLVDNKQANFLYKAITHVKQTFLNCEILFHYPDTGYNDTARGRAINGSFLPVQYINSAIIPFKVIDKQKDAEYLVLCLNDRCTRQNLEGLLNMSQKLTEGWSQGIYMFFSSYDSFAESNIFDEVKLAFRDREFANKVSIDTFDPNFRNLI